MNSQEAWEKQKAIIEYYKNNQPFQIERQKQILETGIFQEIGMYNMPTEKPKGYLRLHPEDFIVEEKLVNGKIVRINNINHDLVYNSGEDKKTLFAHLIKTGIPTNVAIDRIALECNIEKDKIGFAGLKDAEAITSQLVAFSGKKISVDDIKKIKIPNISLSNFYFDKGSLSPGDLIGNVFTITIRTEESLNNEIIGIKLKNIEKFGILNYFQAQRFGGMRLISHKLGKLILQTNYEFAVRYYLFKSSDFDIPLVKELRKEAESFFPNWPKIIEVFNKFPYTFFNEIKLAEYLLGNPENYIGALIEIKDQTQLWIYAYSSWLFNKMLSEHSSTKGCVHEKFPILLSDNPRDYDIYKKYLLEDEIKDMAGALKPFKFIQFKKRLLAGRIFPTDIQHKLFDKGIVINFVLPKGAYATTFLSNLFELGQGLPIPDWVNTAQIDPKELMGQGNIKNIREVLGEYWYSKID